MFPKLNHNWKDIWTESTLELPNSERSVMAQLSDGNCIIMNCFEKNDFLEKVIRWKDIPYY